jgi:hypothetical protein
MTISQHFSLKFDRAAQRDKVVTYREVPSRMQLETGEEGVQWKDTVGVRYKVKELYLLTVWPGSP